MKKVSLTMCIICIISFSACSSKKPKASSVFVSTKCEMVCSNTECNQVCVSVDGTLK